SCEMAWSSCGARLPNHASARPSSPLRKVFPASKLSTITSVASTSCLACCASRKKNPFRPGILKSLPIETAPMKGHPDIVAIGAPSGGIEALQTLLEALSDLDAIALVVLHRPANRASYLRDILLRHVNMPVVVPRHGERLHHGVC